MTKSELELCKKQLKDKLQPQGPIDGAPDLKTAIYFVMKTLDDIRDNDLKEIRESQAACQQKRLPAIEKRVSANTWKIAGVFAILTAIGGLALTMKEKIARFILGG